MAATLQHPNHEHALIRKQLSENCAFDCDICTGRVRGTAYCCEESSCRFFLHESCASEELPLEIAKHPIHPEHPLLLRSGRYSCRICNISLNVTTVIASLPSSLEEEDMIHHAAHEHPLAAFRVKVPNWISCDGCQEPMPGPAYGCHSCGFFLHRSCARLPQEILEHPFHPEHSLTLVFNHKKTFRCKACRADRYNQLAYYCEECEFELDATCAALPLSLQDQEAEDRVAIDHFSHQHRLLSGFVEESEHVGLRCAVCELIISGEVSYCLSCIFFIHKQCAGKLVQDMVHYLHPEHGLVLLPRPRCSNEFMCDCCLNHYHGMVFHCASCTFGLDPECAIQTLSAFRDGTAAKIKHFGHEHSLVLCYIKEAPTLDYCKACYEPAFGLAYHCDSCAYVLHKSCAELPLQLYHPLHSLHPLALIPMTPDKHFICNNCHSQFRGFAFCCPECDFYLCTQCATERPVLKHQLHEHALCYSEHSPDEEDSVRCNSCGKASSIDLYSCKGCNFNLHHECLPLPPIIQHECHTYHPLVLYDRFVVGTPEYQWCDFCEELRNADRGVYRCEECWYTVHIGCVLPQMTRYVNRDPDEIEKVITGLEETIEVKEKDFEASKRKLIRLRAKHEMLSKA